MRFDNWLRKFSRYFTIFQAVSETLDDTVLSLKLQTIYLSLTLFPKHSKLDLIINLKILQGVTMFQVIAVTLANTVFLLKLQAIYL